MSFEFRLLGGVQLRQDGCAIALGSAKRRAVLAALALEANRPVSLERLGDALWAGPPPPSAVANIRTYVAALRRVLGDRIVARDGGYQLRIEPGEFDVDEFVNTVIMKRYYRREAESDLGEGVAYFEFDGEYATRQVEVYGDAWFDSRVPYHPEIGPGLIDQPLYELGMRDEEEITADEFEEIWAEALRRK